MSTYFWEFVLFASIILALRRPLVGFCMVYPLLLLCPLEFSGIPVVHTPFGILVVFTAFAALLQRKALVGRWLPSSPIMVPFVLLVGVLLIFGMIGHGDPEAIAFRVRTYLMGMWPLVLAWLVLKTPSDARTVLLAALVASLVLAVGVLWVVTTQGQSVLFTGTTGNVREFAEDQKVPVSYLKMMALAFCSPVWLSLLLDGVLGPKMKLFVGAAFVAISFCILLSTYSSSVVALVLGTGLVYVARWRQIFRNPLRYIGGVLLFGLLLMGGWVVADKIQTVQYTVNRIRNPQEDFSGGYRIMGILEESGAFLESPLIGHGVAGKEKVTPRGHLLAGHNSITRDAASFGLVFVVPFFTVLVVIGRQYLRLQKKVRSPVDAALLNGLFVSFLVSIAGGVITCTFGDLMQDTYFWTFTAVMLFWNSWAETHPGEPFFAWH